MENRQKEFSILKDENQTLKQEIILMKTILEENNFISTKDPKKEDFDTNDEINHII